ncbi:FtsX-like permease family protein [Luminiphilus sp.]|nr:FtsX-like permease family protein [Luminiphilus sp.]MDA8985800.1 FtsX-like permease family protein [Luminiphilus sp.]
MPWRLRFDIALRQTLDPGHGLSAFLSRIAIVGMALAIAILLTVQSVMNGFDLEMRERILSLVPHVEVTSADASTSWRALEDQLSRDPGIARVRFFASADALLLRGQSVTAARLSTVGEESIAHYARLVKPALSGWNTDGLILGAALASRLELAVGDWVTFILPAEKTVGFEPIRVRLSAVLDSKTELDEVLALVHHDTIEPFAASNRVTTGLALQLVDVFAASQMRWQVAQQVPSEFHVTDWRRTHGNLYSAIQLSRDLIGLILLVVIFVAAFNVVSALMLVVTDRRKVIAMLAAMGARASDIVTIFFLQGAMIGAVGCTLGMILGVVMAFFAPDMATVIEQWLDYPLLETDVYPLAFVPVDIRWQDFATTSAIAMALSVLASIVPALRAASLPVAETLTH